MMNADLHCHSTVSDGQLAPAEVAARAHAGGVTLWALTDHDQLGGQREARAAAEALGMGYLGGVEISVTWAGRTVHIVGLNVDVDNQELIDGLAHAVQGAVELVLFAAKAAIEGFMAVLPVLGERSDADE